MLVNVQKSVFENYKIEGEEHEVIAVLKQLGFKPEVEKLTDDEALQAVSSDQLKPKPTGPDWQEIDQRDLRPGDIIRVQLRCNTEYSPERIVTAFPASNTRVMANTLEEGMESPVSSSDIYSSIQVDMNSRRAPVEEWEQVEFEELRCGDEVRVQCSHGVDKVDRGVCHHVGPSANGTPSWRTQQDTVVAFGDFDYYMIERKIR